MKKKINSVKKSRFLAFSVVLFLSFASYGQQVEKDRIYFISAEQTRGTFQFEVTDEQFCNINVTADLMEQIEKNRHSTDFTFISLNKNCRLKIFPKSMIQELRENPIEPCIIIKNPIKEK